MASFRGNAFGDPARRAVRRALQALPNDWWVVCDHCWQGLDERGRPAPRRADFIVLAPQLGTVVLQVEDAPHVQIGDDGRWSRAAQATGPWTAEALTPIDRATSGVHDLARDLQLAELGCRYGWMVVFPLGELAPGSRFKMFTENSFLFRRELQQIEGRIKTLLDMHAPESRSAAFSTPQVERLVRELGSPRVGMPPAEEIESDLLRIRQITEQQQAALHGIFEHVRIAVFGPAGSGKTVLAIWRLASLIRQGHRAIYVCFTKKLATYLRKSNPDLASSIFNVDKYFYAILGGRVPEDEGASQEYFDTKLPNAVIDHASEWEEARRLDAIIVDEGQDFGETRLAAILSLLKEQGGIYVYFADGAQDLFQDKEASAVGADVAYQLVHNCRNTTRINDRANHVSRKAVKHMPGAPEGAHPMVVTCPSATDIGRKAWEIAQVFRKEHDRVAILSRRALAGSAMGPVVDYTDGRLVERLDDWDKEGGVLFSTIRGFKGLEADAVVLVDVDDLAMSASAGDHMALAELYVAMTRGCVALAVICSNLKARSVFEAPR
jgi:hypothetical protein